MKYKKFLNKYHLPLYMGNRTLNLLIAGSIAASSFLYACQPKAVKVNPPASHSAGISSLDEALKLEPYKDGKIGGQYAQLLKQIHDDPYDKRYIDEAIRDGVDAELIYHAIGFGLSQFELQNNKMIDKFHKSGKKETRDGGIVVDELADMLWKQMYYFKIIGDLLREGKPPNNTMQAVKYWQTHVAELK